MPIDDTAVEPKAAAVRYMGHPVASAGKPETEIKVAHTKPSAALMTQMNRRRAYRKASANGASHTGAATFRMQRLTALALVPLTVWFVASLLTAILGSAMTARAWLGNPVNAALLAGLILVALRHATIGIQVVLEDYVHPRGTRTVLLLLLYASSALVGLASVTGLIVLIFQTIGAS